MPLTHDSLKPFLSTLPAVLYEFLRHPDGSGEMKYVSPNSTAILGYPPDYFTGADGIKWDFIHPDDRERFRSVDRSNDLFSIVIRVVGPSGDVKWVRVLSRPETIEDNGDVVWAGCVLDINDLKEAQEEINLLKNILPICAYCKGIRDDDGYWKSVEKYISSHSKTEFSHGICDECLKEHFPKIYYKKHR